MPFQPPTLVTSAIVGEDNYAELCSFIKKKCEHLDRRLENFRSQKLPEYVRLYKARPKTENVDWPWPGAANLVIPIIATYSDELLARIMGGIWMYDPLWSTTLSGDIPSKDGEELKLIVQDFMMDMAYSPEELALYQTEQAFFHSATKYGTGVIYSPYEYQKKVQRIYDSGGVDDNSKVTSHDEEYVAIDGPRPSFVPLNRFIFEPEIPKLEDMKLFGHIEKYDYWELRDLPSKNPYYTEKDIEAIKQNPDAIQDTEMERELVESKGFDAAGVDDGAARWYIYKLWFKFYLRGKEYSFEAAYHMRSKTIFWICFNRYPKNMLPYETSRLAYDDESFLGMGFAEMLHMAQKEVSNNNNWRTNNRNYAMLGVWRIDPESKLGSMLDMYPGVGIPARQNELEYIKAGADLGYSDAPDQFHLAISKERAGVDPSMGGTGGGIVNPKRGIYSAAGTSMVMAQQNNRNNLRTSDMRSAHVKLGLKFLTMYAHFGIGDKLRKYGSNAEKLKKALDLYKSGQLGLRLRPSSASMNKELERQNDVMLSQQVNAFYQQEAQMIQAINTPNIPPPLQKYYTDVLLGSRAMMMALLRNFNKDNVDVIIPDIDHVIATVQAQQQQEQVANANQQHSGPSAVPTVPQGSVGVGGVPSGSGAS